MGNGSGKFDVTHSFTAYLKVGNFNAATVADYSLVTDRLKLSTVTFPFFGCTKDTFTEKTFLLGSKRPVVDSLRFFYLAV
jgi:hypothetical protein